VSRFRKDESVKDKCKTRLASFSCSRINEHGHDSMRDPVPGERRSPAPLLLKVKVFVAPLGITHLGMDDAEPHFAPS
jgi:hypothetical protein